MNLTPSDIQFLLHLLSHPNLPGHEDAKRAAEIYAATLRARGEVFASDPMNESDSSEAIHASMNRIKEMFDGGGFVSRAV